MGIPKIFVPAVAWKGQKGALRLILHIGSDHSVFLKDVVLILDRETAEQARSTREYFQVAQSEKRLKAELEGETKSYVITRDAVYRSPISSTTLARRAAAPLEE